MKIEMGKEYQTRAGEKARILCIDFEDDDYPVVAVIDKKLFHLDAYGNYFGGGTQHEYDLIENEKRYHFLVGNIVHVKNTVYVHSGYEDYCISESRVDDWLVEQRFSQKGHSILNLTEYSGKVYYVEND